jgi:hypothetical protein
MQLLTNNTSDKSKALVGKVINKLEGLSKPRKYFMISIIILYLSMRGRYTFKGMERYGSKCEKTYRLNFEKCFDFLKFNIELSKAHLSEDRILVFDPSYLPKSGKHTPGKGRFWSGCLGRAVQGIEIGGLGVVDLKHNTAFNLESVQTPSPSKLKSSSKTLVDHYAEVIVQRKGQLRELARYLAVDGYFSKQSFVNQILEKTDLQLVSKLRKDANLKYLYKGPKRKGRGRPKKYDGKVDTKNIDKRRFKWCYQNEDAIVYQATVWSVSLKRIIKVAYVEFLDKGVATTRYAFYFSTDLKLAAKQIYRFYKARFQIEFLFRDAKQHVGLTNCQARSENKIHFHTNASLTAVGVAKIAHHINRKEEGKPFSLANIKTSYFNEHMLNLFFSNFQIDPNLMKNKSSIRKLLEYGNIAS